MPDDGAVTLRDIAGRLDSVSTSLATLTGNVTTALADGSRVMQELRDEMRSLRADREDDRQRITRAEGDIRALQNDGKTQALRRTTYVGWGITGIIGMSGWVSALVLWHPWSR